MANISFHPKTCITINLESPTAVDSKANESPPRVPAVTTASHPENYLDTMKSLKTMNEVLDVELSLHRNNLKLTKSGVAKDPFTPSTVYVKTETRGI